MIKSLTLILAVFAGSICCGQEWVGYNVYYQPVPVSVSVQAPVVTMVPMVVQKEVLVNTWGFRPILTPNYVFYPYSYRPCLFRPFQSPVVQPTIPVYTIYPYRY